VPWPILLAGDTNAWLLVRWTYPAPGPSVFKLYETTNALLSTNALTNWTLVQVVGGQNMSVTNAIVANTNMVIQLATGYHRIVMTASNYYGPESDPSPVKVLPDPVGLASEAGVAK
jgi:hypothetical protein